MAPAGNNAIEIYLGVPASDPRKLAASQALLELMSPAAAAIERTILSNEFDEADRQLVLLQRMNASEITLGPLRTQLVAAKKQTADDAIAAAAPPPVVIEPKAPAAPSLPPAANASAPAVSSLPEPRPAQSTPRSAASASGEPAAAPAVATAAPALPAPTAVPAAASSPATATKEARQIADAAPVYPPAAMRRRIEGMVELEFTVGADGALSDIRVVRSDPPGTFDREAMRAAQRWRFSPRTVDGTPTSSKVRKTLNFRLKASQG